ncbi:MAG TPA: hypothetical protein VN493_24495 [Thermoanaerobaculia bacterium]|nr:hypothetical protein [Thermoanaerobaculia bacterium]
MRKRPLFFALLLPAALLSLGQAAGTRTFPLDSAEGLKNVNVLTEAATYQGRKAVRVVETPAGREKDAPTLVLVPGTEIEDGIIEVEVAGKPGAGAPSDARGFVGVVFRATPDGSKHEGIYIRPTNGRADDQLRRNRSAQYFSYPEFPWHRLRKEAPGQYESYVDLVPGEWTKLRIQVSGTTARLYVHGAEQPALIINDLKLGKSKGAVGLWVGQGTEGYFTNLRVSP